MPKASTRKPQKAVGVYERVLVKAFAGSRKRQAQEVIVTRRQIEEAAATLGVDPKNVGDIVYSFRYRRPLPPEIRAAAPKGKVWIIRGAGAAQYRFCAVDEGYAYIRPRVGLSETRIPDGTPGIIATYALDDEQALLAKVRYNRLVDIFTGVACYSLQSHLRTQIPGIGQIETDEIYVGLDKEGAHFAIPVQAKGGSDQHSIVQIEQDFAMCQAKFPRAVCRPIAAQFMANDKIALFSFALSARGDARILAEKHYVLVNPKELSREELEEYRRISLAQGV